MYGTILLSAFAALVLIVAAGFVRFAIASRKEAKKADGYKTPAGGDLIVQGGKTYFILPSGQRRKLADYAMDLTPGSKDMARFEAIMAEAHRQHEAEKSNERKASISMMHDVAKEAMRDA